MNTQIKDVGLVIMAIVVVIGLFMGLPRIDQLIKSRAITECGTVAASADKVSGFNGAVYKACVEDKGYTSSIQ